MNKIYLLSIITIFIFLVGAGTTYAVYSIAAKETLDLEVDSLTLTEKQALIDAGYRNISYIHDWCDEVFCKVSIVANGEKIDEIMFTYIKNSNEDFRLKLPRLIERKVESYWKEKAQSLIPQAPTPEPAKPYEKEFSGEVTFK